jgi:cysteine synthase A
LDTGKDGVLCAIGNTPLVPLRKVFAGRGCRVYGKLECLNPGGSTKDRPAFNILHRAIQSGRITSRTVVIESSSGNMGVGLAQACSYLGLKLICVVDLKTTAQNIRLLRAYGAEVDIVRQPDPASGDFLPARLQRVQDLLREEPNSFWPDQYSNLDNPAAHWLTLQEIIEALPEPVDYLFCATSTCGTLRGCADYIRRHGLPTKLIAVDAEGSVLFGGERRKRLIPGHGAAIVPRLFRPGLAHGCIHVSDVDCVVGCRRLALQEAILAGGSSGAVIMAIEQALEWLPHDALCVAILVDRGERYLDTVFSDSWVCRHLGDISHLWTDHSEAKVCMATR